jgi:L-ascorbate metabolism protein UlaG (beta-lactamase superfamily)
MIDQIQWLGHASFRIQGPPLIYINPWRITRNAFHADAIIVTNDLFDHCSPADVEKLRGPETVVLASAHAADALSGDVIVLRPWQCMNIGEACITAVPAYTFTDHYPVSKGGLGFVVSIDYYDIYYAGVTDWLPELERLRADIAIVPIDAGPGTLDQDGMETLVDVMEPEWVIPSHWGTFGGTHLDVHAWDHALDGKAKVAAFDKVR